MELTRRKWLAGAGGLLVGACGIPEVLATSTRHGGVRTLGGPAFGTYWRSTMPHGTDETAVRQAIEAIIAAVDQSMSPFRADSEISRFNAARSIEPVAASGPFRSVVAESLRIAELSGGAFDPTIGPLVNRYGFGPIRGNARARFTDITIANGSIRKATPDATLDLCGIAKGFALDSIAAALDKLGVEDFVVELGGEVLARGRHPAGRPWRIAIEVPKPADKAMQRVVRLDGKALATSGDTVNGYAFAGRRYSHIIGPQRSEPVDGRMASVSVIATSAIEADALATAVMALGPGKGAAFSARLNVPTLILLRAGTGIRERAVAGFHDHFAI
ncbi:MAG: FAD:protein FMN transferase [Hyphomicrobiaceae bacterium]